MKRVLFYVFFLMFTIVHAQVALVADINVGANSSSPQFLQELNNRLYFVARNSAGNAAIYYMDANENVVALSEFANDVLVRDMKVYQTSLIVATQYIGPNTLLDDNQRLFRVNANSGTQEFLPFFNTIGFPIALFSNFFEYNNELYFAGDYHSGNPQDADDIELFAFNGSSVRLVDDEITDQSSPRDGNGSLSPTEFAVHEGELFFKGNVTETTWGVYKSNGSFVSLVTNLGQVQPFDLKSFNSTLFYVGTSSGNSSNPLVYSLATATTGSLPSVVSAYYYRGSDLTVLDNELLFSGSLAQTGDPNLVVELLAVDNQGVVRQIPKGTQTNDLRILTYSKVVNNVAYFLGRTDLVGNELFGYTPNGSLRLLEDYNPGPENSSPLNFQGFNNKVYFAAIAGFLGTELHSYQPQNTSQSITMVPDLEFERFLSDNGWDTNPNPGEVFTSDIQNVTELSIQGYDILEFTGLGDFTNLERFTLIDNQAAGIMEISFMGNPILNFVNIINVPNLAGVDISGNPDLQSLTLVPRGLRFNAIDLSGKTNLTSLLLADSAISSIDLSVVPNLTYLGLQLNQSLRAVDLSTLPLLEALDTYESAITSIDLSNNPLVTRLTAYRSFNGALGNVNLKNGSTAAITNLQLENNPNLTCIQVDANLAGTLPANWTIDQQTQLSENCGSTCNAINFADPSLEAFLLNPDTPNRIRDVNGNPIDLNQNGQVCETRAETVAYLDLSNTQNITQLTDLFRFPALLELNIGGDLNTLSSIDVSQNLNLEVLVASGFKANGFMLQLRNNSKLRELYAYNSGSDLDINPQDNPDIEVLSIGGFGQNPFSGSSAINVSQYPNLREFRALELSGLSSFGLANAPNLTRVELFDTSVETVDLSNSPLLEEALLTLNRNLASVNVQNGTNNPTLQFLGVDANTANTCVQVDNIGYANEQVNLGNWSISSANFSESCANVVRPTIQWGTVTSTIEGETVNQPVVLINGDVPAGGLDLSFGLVTGGTAQATPAASPQNELDDFIFVSGGTAPVSYGFGIGEGSYTTSSPVAYELLDVYDDERFEGNETIRIEILSADVEIIGNPILEYTIVDNDYRVSVDAGNAIDEENGTSNFTFTLTDENGLAVTNVSGRSIELSWLDLGNAQQGSDYTLSGDGIIANGQQSTSVTITGLDDNIFEGEEFAGLEVQLGDGYTLDPNNLPTSSLAINDNDNVAVFQAAQVGIEGTQDTGFSIGLQDSNGILATNGTQNSVVFDIEFSSGTGANAATIIDDFANGIKNSPDATVAIEPGQSGTFFEVVIVDDNQVEPQENFLAIITFFEADMVLPSTTAVGLINDNDNAAPDTDGDGIVDTDDNCPDSANPDQSDLDADTIGDMCDLDIDGDGVPNTEDTFPLDGTESNDNDADGTGDNADADDDNDNVLDINDAFPFDNAEATDSDNDGIGNNADTDDDNDGVLDVNDNCPLQPGTMENSGCPSTEPIIGLEDISVLVVSETCPDQNNGSFSVTISNPTYVFNILLDGVEVGTAGNGNEFVFNGLANGNYQLCARLDNWPSFNRCFGINIRTYDRLEVEMQSIDPINLRATYSLSGSTSYTIRTNGKSYNYSFNSNSKNKVTVPMKLGENQVVISGSSDCQGIYEEVVQLGSVSVFPNPTKGLLHFDNGLVAETANVSMYTLSGQLIGSEVLKLTNGSTSIDMSSYPNGMYLIQFEADNQRFEFKVIKN